VRVFLFAGEYIGARRLPGHGAAATTTRSPDIMRFSVVVAAVLGGIQAASALKLSPRNLAEREQQVATALLNSAKGSTGQRRGILCR